MQSKAMQKWMSRGGPVKSCYGSKMFGGGRVQKGDEEVHEYKSPMEEFDEFEDEDDGYSFGGAVPGIKKNYAPNEEDEIRGNAENSSNFYGRPWKEEKNDEYDSRPAIRSQYSEANVDVPKQRKIGQFAKGGMVGLAMALKKRR